jgi:hypothetical protein
MIWFSVSIWHVWSLVEVPHGIFDAPQKDFLNPWTNIWHIKIYAVFGMLFPVFCTFLFLKINRFVWNACTFQRAFQCSKAATIITAKGYLLFRKYGRENFHRNASHNLTSKHVSFYSSTGNISRSSLSYWMAHFRYDRVDWDSVTCLKESNNLLLISASLHYKRISQSVQLIAVITENSA